MPINGQSIGKDLSFTLVTSYGVLTLTGITEYDIKPQFTDLKHKGQNGETTHGVIPDGWQITFKIDRVDSTVDDYFAQLEADYFNGINSVSGTSVETIVEPDGSVNQYQYNKVVLKYDDAGSWKGDALVPISVTAMASRRVKVA